MPIEYDVDHERRLVRARALGLITAETLFEYQQAVWSDPALAGYDELVDMSGVEQVDAPSSSNVSALAGFSARMDGHINPTKFAIVAPDDLTYGLGRMYQAFREMKPGSTKEVAVFRSLPDALAWLGHHL
jgi:hypothetical protein